MACIHEGLSGNPVQAIKPFFALATPVFALHPERPLLVFIYISSSMAINKVYKEYM